MAEGQQLKVICQLIGMPKRIIISFYIMDEYTLICTYDTPRGGKQCKRAVTCELLSNNSLFNLHTYNNKFHIHRIKLRKE
ncbi:CLUMA_CG004974, isoform A [Clunio marinus]|uniref:CLUMA_CG004974, isoform A n=1 Tax=Clunio marinus TaxID=568069 RepID=A0A1J1HTA6_9DIPT|nr:CLUMA_CG004974, isoform A [Clunio marinus]